MKNIILGFGISIVLVSCSAVSSLSKLGGKQASIADTQWVLAETVKGKTPTLVLEGNRVSGNAGCNNYFGDVVLDTTAGNFSVKNVGSTRMSCDNMSVEQNYLSMIQQADKYVVNGDVLELYKGNLLLVKFNKK
ncbi:MAG: META domain-containing protein [Cruoricaptor ignavus]|nr:META domain-containing protein [Cruoricaptor ignavus]